MGGEDKEGTECSISLDEQSKLCRSQFWTSSCKRFTNLL